ncbi:hypothetical protein [Ruminococcus albus]|uniref:Uncharacterized protein n=1 Tax=Ruminococcus albus TaxID=1264 RepID=A0A1I1FUY3_RUMAL|nr:hypothetical protein [Ruminococcus albus]SFC03071.1 hypothetical protein SAMN02910406_01024 [Ruminococcus albus]
MSSHEDFLLAESPNFEIRGCYERAVLVDKAAGTKSPICEMYGDPEGALIDNDERFAVVYGCGAVVCYTADGAVREISSEWIDSARQISAEEIELVYEDGSREGIKV